MSTSVVVVEVTSQFHVEGEERSHSVVNHRDHRLTLGGRGTLRYTLSTPVTR